MKCPKCDYLGFETGDRCKNCGYDFSLLSIADSDPPDYDIYPAAVDDVPVHVIDDMGRHDRWLDNREEPLGNRMFLEPSSRDDVDEALDDALTSSLTPESPFQPSAPPPIVSFMSSGSPAATESALPLFTPTQNDDDEPLIKLPSAPRAPLAVRRTPDTPRLRAVPPRSVSRPSPGPVLQFSDEVVERSAPPDNNSTQPIERLRPGVVTAQASRPGARLIAVLIDHLILFGIDAAVVYFTLRMAGLSMAEWSVLPVAPMATFLGLLKVAYFYAFTAVGGQTIGKMAVGTCVVADNGAPVDAAGAMRRTSAGVVSFLLFGLGFVPALFGDHRALHDRLAGTRVVRVRSV